MLFFNSQKLGTISQAPDFIDQEIRRYLVSARMRSAIQEKILDLLYVALRPLVHLLIESGIGHREFSEVVKRAYVDVASKNYGLRGRETNISRVAVMTGLTRKEVKRVRDELSGDLLAEGTKPIPASVILHQWFSNPKYASKTGEPAVLPFDGDSPSFTELVKAYAGDIPPGAIRTELVRVGSAEVTDDGSVRPLRRYYLPPEGGERLLRAIERPLALMAANIKQNNLVPKAAKDHLTWPEMIVQISNIDRRRRLESRDFAYQEILRYAEELDESLSRFIDQKGTERSEDSGLSVGVGFYYFESN